MLNLFFFKLIYFIKKECNVNFLKILTLGKRFKLLNVLKSPIQFKVGRNQFAVFKYKIIFFLNVIKLNKKYIKFVKYISLYLLTKLFVKNLNSAVSYKLITIYNNRV